MDNHWTIFHHIEQPSPDEAFNILETFDISEKIINFGEENSTFIFFKRLLTCFHLCFQTSSHFLPLHHIVFAMYRNGNRRQNFLYTIYLLTTFLLSKSLSKFGGGRPATSVNQKKNCSLLYPHRFILFCAHNSARPSAWIWTHNSVISGFSMKAHTKPWLMRVKYRRVRCVRVEIETC